MNPAQLPLNFPLTLRPPFIHFLFRQHRSEPDPSHASHIWFSFSLVVSLQYPYRRSHSGASPSHASRCCFPLPSKSMLFVASGGKTLKKTTRKNDSLSTQSGQAEHQSQVQWVEHLVRSVTKNVETLFLLLTTHNYRNEQVSMNICNAPHSLLYSFFSRASHTITHRS
jgi:hypothetical protein